MVLELPQLERSRERVVKVFDVQSILCSLSSFCLSLSRFALPCRAAPAASKLYHLYADSSGWGESSADKYGYGTIKGSGFFQAVGFAEDNSVRFSALRFPRSLYRAFVASLFFRVVKQPSKLLLNAASNKKVDS